MRFELHELVGRLGITALYVTHDQAEALAMSDIIAVMSDGLIAQCGSPRAVYDRPDDPFVAGFLGTANMLDATAVGPGGTRLLLALDGNGQTIGVDRAGDIAPGERVQLVFRPEDVVLRLEADGGEGRLCGVVTRVSFQGAMTECHLTVGARVVRAFVRPSVDLAPGTTAWLELDPARCIVMRRNRAGA
jgi:iron(III) transport system ATP-binding protein